MILDAMKKIDALGVSMCEAHPDIEVFRLRLGKAIDFEYFEDTQTGLFQRRDPREGAQTRLSSYLHQSRRQSSSKRGLCGRCEGVGVLRRWTMASELACVRLPGSRNGEIATMIGCLHMPICDDSYGEERKERSLKMPR